MQAAFAIATGAGADASSAAPACTPHPPLHPAPQPLQNTPHNLHPTSCTPAPHSCRMHPTPCTLHPDPSRMHPTTCTLHPTLSPIHPVECIPRHARHSMHPAECIMHHCTLHPTVCNLHPIFCTMHSTTCTVHPALGTIVHRTPHTASCALHPAPCVPHRPGVMLGTRAWPSPVESRLWRVNNCWGLGRGAASRGCQGFAAPSPCPSLLPTGAGGSRHAAGRRGWRQQWATAPGPPPRCREPEHSGSRVHFGAEEAPVPGARPHSSPCRPAGPSMPAAPLRTVRRSTHTR